MPPFVMALVMALIVSFIGVVSLALARKFEFAAVLFAISTVIFWLVFYLALPTLVYPLFGWVGVAALLVSICAAGLDSILSYSDNEDISWVPWLMPVLGVLAFILFWIAGWGMFRANDYAKLIGPMEERTWTQDIQPADPAHIRLVPPELAMFLADKQLGEAPGSLGSQFHIDRDHAIIQRISGELWYVIPLDFNGFAVWTSADVAPGYIMVHGDDPTIPPVLKNDQNFRYTMGAFMWDNLERHLWSNGYLFKGLTDFTLEVDEEGKAWWVVTVFEPTIVFSGKKVTGVAMVDPQNGDITYYSNDSIPTWVDRVVPDSFVENWIDNWGDLTGGWVNSWWGKHNLMTAGEPEIVYGSDGEPYFETDVTSPNLADQSLVGIIYTHSRTSKSVFYKASGGTDEGILTVVNNQVGYKKWHGASPVLYNLYGVMTLVVPTLGEGHTFTGVALARVDNQQVAVADTLANALREYQKLLAGSGDKVDLEKAHGSQEIEGRVDRFSAEVVGGNTIYSIHLVEVPHLFTGGSSELSPKLPLTREGDTVTIVFVPSGRDVEPMTSFDNQSLPLSVTKLQTEVREVVEERLEGEAAKKDADDARVEIKQMNDADLQELMRLRNEKKPSDDEKKPAKNVLFNN